ncbi:hypothetical protein BJX64DRAFT_302193 [Aspergillus heterothallicus]
MDYERCAALHNELLFRGRTGAGNEWIEPQTWQNLFFFITCLAWPEDIVSLNYLGLDSNSPDRFLLLYISSGFMLGDEQGILFDQHTFKATYIIYGWLPLEVILNSYLDMIDEGKVSIFRDFIYSENEAVAALRRLIIAIESRMEETTNNSSIHLPWHDPVTLNQTFIPPDSFAHVFLSAVPTWTVRFRYLAPGIRFPTVAEFLDQAVGEPEYPGGCSLRVFQMDPEEGQEGAQSQNMRTHGLFLDNVITEHPEYFANGSSLRLPFAIGCNRMARMSNGQLIRIRDHNSLYQQGYNSNGIDNGHFVQIHKVLDSWAQRVEQEGWDVGEDGVRGALGSSGRRIRSSFGGSTGFHPLATGAIGHTYEGVMHWGSDQYIGLCFGLSFEEQKVSASLLRPRQEIHGEKEFNVIAP